MLPWKVNWPLPKHRVKKVSVTPPPKLIGMLPRTFTRVTLFVSNFTPHNLISKDDSLSNSKGNGAFKLSKALKVMKK
jgi:hypothetical protein